MVGVVCLMEPDRKSLLRLNVALALLLAPLFPSTVRAQVMLPQINPGQIEGDVERQRRRLELREQVPRQQGPAVVGPQRPPPITIPGGGDRFLLRKVVFEPSKFITPEELNAIAAKYVGKQVDIAALQNLLTDINEIYSQRGIVTAIATLPEQTADGGVVKIKLTEGRLQNTVVQGNKQTSERYIRGVINPPAGEVLDVPKLNRDIVWFNRTNDVQIRALLQPGTDFGLTDLQLAVTEPPIDTWQIFVDNQGVQTTGRYQVGTFYKRHGLLGIDDRLTFYGVRSEGNLNGNIAYNIPFNPWGGRVGVSYNEGKIKIIKGPSAPLDVSGKSNQFSANLSQPVYATDAWLLQAIGGYTRGNTDSDLAEVRVIDDHYNKYTGGLSLVASGTQYSVTFSPSFNAIDWYDNILGRERNFNTATGSLVGFGYLPASFNIVALASWQYTWEKLLPGDQLFTIGGPTTVRGYPTNTVAGDSGYYYNFEFHRNMSDIIKGLDLFAFIDGGSVYSTAPKSTQLNSSGVGMSLTPHPAFTFETSVGIPWHTVIVDQRRYQWYGRITMRPLQLIDALVANN